MLIMIFVGAAKNSMQHLISILDRPRGSGSTNEEIIYEDRTWAFGKCTSMRREERTWMSSFHYKLMLCQKQKQKSSMKIRLFLCLKYKCEYNECIFIVLKIKFFVKLNSVLTFNSSRSFVHSIAHFLVYEMLN